MVSTRQKARALYFVYCALNRLGGRSLKLRRDTLGRRYAVNRHGVDVEHDSKTVIASVRRDLIAFLVQNGWKREDRYGDDWLTKDGVLISVRNLQGYVAEAPGYEKRFGIAVH